ncbi:sulfotransferase [Myxosarcina sp. GI1(2024)]
MENRSSKIYIHIGYAKAASTTLQKHLFDKHPEINNLGIYPTNNLGKDSSEINYKCAYFENESLRKFYHNLVMTDGIEYRRSNNIQLYKESIKPLFKLETINLFSNERFTSVAFSHSDIKNKADRLKEIFPDAKIIIILRNQSNIIISKYREWPFDPRCVMIGKPVSLDNWIKIALEDNHTKYLSNLKYYEIVELYSEMFGKSNVGLFLFEDLVYKPEYFAHKFSQFLGIELKYTQLAFRNKHENSSLSYRYNIYRMLCRKKLLPNLNSNKLDKIMPDYFKQIILDFLRSGKRKEYKISPFMQIKINNYFGKSNSKLQDKYKLNLSDYNYPV